MESNRIYNLKLILYIGYHNVFYAFQNFINQLSDQLLHFYIFEFRRIRYDKKSSSG